MTPQMNTTSYNASLAGQVGSVTNDPSTAKSRVFVGNLNTIALSKEDVEQIFSRYGMVTGLSMHKGYAFVQYGSQMDARRACGAEDGMTYAGQALDINIASEPKHRPTNKTSSTSQASSGASRVLNTQSGPPAKKQRTDSGMGGIKRTLVNLTSGNSSSAPASKSITQLAQAAKDVLICGVCKTTSVAYTAWLNTRRRRADSRSLVNVKVPHLQSPLSPPSWCVPRVMRSSLLPGISVSMLSRNTASAYTKRRRKQ